MDINHRKVAKREITRGFSVIELIVVISILVVLAALIFPVVIAAKEKSHSTACLSNIRQLGAATLIYASDNGGRLPQITYQSPAQSTTVNYHDLVQKGAVLKCSKINVVVANRPTLSTGYCINERLHDAVIKIVDGKQRFDFFPGKDLSEVEKPAITALYGECSPFVMGLSGPEHWYFSPNHFIEDHKDEVREPLRASSRHAGGAHYVFVDGHARWLHADFFVRPTNFDSFHF
ncbi:MAG: prepilin-type N-terminal cleavage/methylation domain-containing protein [Fimbriimonadaceae bacterium]|nr:prepilin-type N-terminal cleavage/methylation domain-containing protein [Fimbriimonadaceae bacterium]